MTKESLQLVKSIIDARIYEGDKTPSEESPESPLMKPLVTISRCYGVSDGNIAALLAERLKVQLFDKELLNAIVNETKDDKHLLITLDERVTHLVDDILHSFFSKKNVNADTYFRYMAKVILGIAPMGGVIVGRAAHLLLSRKQTFRVRLEGSLENCAKRIAKRREMKYDKAKKLVLKTNEERSAFERHVAKRFPKSVAGFDLIIDTDRLSSEGVVKIIVAAMTAMGFNIPQE